MLSFDTSRRRSTTDGNWQDYVGRTEWCLGPACSRTFWLSAARHHPPAMVVRRHKRADYLHSEIEVGYHTAQTPIFQPVASVTAQQCVVNKIELPDHPPSRTAVFWPPSVQCPANVPDLLRSPSRERRRRLDACRFSRAEALAFSSIRVIVPVDRCRPSSNCASAFINWPLLFLRTREDGLLYGRPNIQGKISRKMMSAHKKTHIVYIDPLSHTKRYGRRRQSNYCLVQGFLCSLVLFLRCAEFP